MYRDVDNTPIFFFFFFFFFLFLLIFFSMRYSVRIAENIQENH